MNHYEHWYASVLALLLGDREMQQNVYMTPGGSQVTANDPRFYENSDNRTGVKTTGLFSPPELVHYVGGGHAIPLLNMKKVSWKDVRNELVWFLNGDTNVQNLRDMGTTIWDEWEKEDGTIGPGYGTQWRSWDASKVLECTTSYDESGVPNHTLKSNVSVRDQISDLLAGIRGNPQSRRHIVSAWNVSDLSDMALPPCHLMFQVHVSGSYLNLKWYQRSADWFLGVPYNMASYSMLLCLLAAATDTIPGTVVGTFGDAHLYETHKEAAREYLNRYVWHGMMRSKQTQPVLVLNPKVSLSADLKSLKPDWIEVLHYQPLPPIKAPVAV